jgi:hypothetical protein
MKDTELQWYEWKDPVATVLGLSHDAMHVVFAGVIFALLFLLLRPRPIAIVAAWLVVLALEVLNEIGDAVDWIGWTGSVNWLETVKDLLLTMILPTVGLLIHRILLRSGPATIR